jgi:colicin import membrane protein
VAALALRAQGVAPGQDRALVWSLAGHGLLLLLVLIGGIVIPRSQPLTPLAIKATLVDPRTLRRPPVSAPVKPPVKPEVKPEPPAEPKPESKPEPRVEERRVEEARRAAQEKQQREKAEAAAVAKRVEARKKEQALQDKQRAEQKKAQQAAEKQRQEKSAAERAKAEAERLQAEKLKAARLKEEAAQREIARQLADEEQLENSEALARYGDLIRQKVERNWSRPPTALAGLECEVSVTQIPGGQVTDVQTERCNGDEAVRRSIVAAVLKASPLPLPDDARLFERNLRFTFKPEQ